MTTSQNDRRGSILAIAEGLFAARGIAATTVREIGADAGVFSGTLYYYFSSKDAIVAELLDQYMQDIQTMLTTIKERSPNPEDAVTALIHGTLSLIDSHPNLTAIYHQDQQYLRECGLLDHVKETGQEVRAYWLEVLHEGVRAGCFRHDVPVETFYRAIRETMWSSWQWSHRNDYTPAEHAHHLVQLFMTGYTASSPG